jgi:transposase
MISEYFSKDLSHHGIVATVCDQIGLVDIIDCIIPPDPRTEITTGESVKLMVINGLGFSSRPLYLEAQFFESKPVGRLLDRNLDSNQITDDRLGRCLDRCYENGCSQIFAKIATKAAFRYNVDQRFRHLDTTSMNVHGEYVNEEEIGLVKFGYSKDHRSDLKQFMISLMSSKDGDVPLLAQTIAGNTSDKTHFQEVLKTLKEQINTDYPSYYVSDSALYTEKTITEISDELMWITRVPEAVKAAKDLLGQISVENMQAIGNGYHISEVGSIYGNIRQRWLVIFSEQAYAREVKTFNKQIHKEFIEKSKELKVMSTETFACIKDAQKVISLFEKKLKYHLCIDITISEKRIKCGRGRPKKDEVLEVVYMVNAVLKKNDDEISKRLKKKGKFIIATNELDEDKLSNEDLLNGYKGQQCVERGFRFLKDPLFMTSSVFLKKQERIIALGMIMCLCLLVYSLAQRLLRKRIWELDTTLPDQRGKPTTTPTMRWIFQIFEGVHVLFHQVADQLEELVLNLTPERTKILEVLGPPFQKIYENSR